ncbi:hypothetical protein Krac_10434 [Ktedonobacter racemifer DSM 44963]|uniref:Uncharacterized protein n=1 Tax=Ktedonobacter racemifer DSM 44963 TaxID=485913 RepID=D6TGZ2_KTERA|nr:hypothetical protein Krac_10434 [Ktedonobacter racemifer DSM 44963]
MQGYTRNQEQDHLQVFHVVGGARPFRRIEEPEQWQGVLFGREELRHGKAYYIHLKADKVREYIEQGKPVYAMQTIEGRRTTLPYQCAIIERWHATVDDGEGKERYFLGLAECSFPRKLNSLTSRGVSRETSI